MIGKLENIEIEHLLNRQFIGRIGCHANNLTYVVPISYAYDGDYIYAHTFTGQKLDIMRKNPSVCFQVDDTRNLANWQSVICLGEFEELTKEKDRKKALEILNNRSLTKISSETMHINSEWPFTPNHKEKVTGIFFRIRIREKTGRYEKTTVADFFTH